MSKTPVGKTTQGQYRGSYARKHGEFGEKANRILSENNDAEIIQLLQDVQEEWQAIVLDAYLSPYFKNNYEKTIDLVNQYGHPTTKTFIQREQRKLDPERNALAARIDDTLRERNTFNITSLLQESQNFEPWQLSILNSFIEYHFQNDYEELLDTTGNSILHKVASFGHPSTVSFLIARGAQINAGNDNGITPMDFAISDRRAAIIRALLDSGYDKNIPDGFGLNFYDRLNAALLSATIPAIKTELQQLFAEAVRQDYPQADERFISDRQDLSSAKFLIGLFYSNQNMGVMSRNIEAMIYRFVRHPYFLLRQEHLEMAQLLHKITHGAGTEIGTKGFAIIQPNLNNHAAYFAIEYDRVGRTADSIYYVDGNCPFSSRNDKRGFGVVKFNVAPNYRNQPYELANQLKNLSQTDELYNGSSFSHLVECNPVNNPQPQAYFCETKKQTRGNCAGKSLLLLARFLTAVEKGILDVDQATIDKAEQDAHTWQKGFKTHLVNFCTRLLVQLQAQAEFAKESQEILTSMRANFERKSQLEQQQYLIGLENLPFSPPAPSPQDAPIPENQLLLANQFEEFVNSPDQWFTDWTLFLSPQADLPEGLQSPNAEALFYDPSPDQWFTDWNFILSPQADLPEGLQSPSAEALFYDQQNIGSPQSHR